MHNSPITIEIKNELVSLAANSNSNPARFFKTSPGSYSQHDQFIGVPVPQLRTVAKKHSQISLQEIKELLQSPINEERLLALIILVEQYKKGSQHLKTKIYHFYLENLRHVNNWNLVDSSAHLILGAHLLKQDTSILFQLAQSQDLWERRIAIVATWYFIRHHQFQTTIDISKILIQDSHDLIHKAVGWMLREIGKKNETLLKNFLNKHAQIMPHIMLSYALEKFPDSIRKKYRALKKQSQA